MFRRATPTIAIVLTSVAMLLAAPAAQADTSYDAEGERRARMAGEHLVGQPGPAVGLTTIDGSRIDLAELVGNKPVYLKFWATWCVPCFKQMPGFQKIHETMGDRIAVIAVNAGFGDDLKAVRDYVAKMGLTMPVAMDDGSLAAQLNLRVTPQHIVIGRDGRIAHIGHLDDGKLHAALERAIAPTEGKVAARPVSAGTKHFGVGDRVSGLDASGLDGKPVALGAGKARALVFFAPWCESYLAESRPATSKACARVREQADALSARGKVDWLGVSSGLWATEDDLKDYRRDTGTKLPLALDPKNALFRAFGVRDIPTVVLIDREGRVTRILGPDDTALDAALRGL